jgi:outer membrane protein OmpA-like peptidoglycan-associated protein
MNKKTINKRFDFELKKSALIQSIILSGVKICQLFLLIAILGIFCFSSTKADENLNLKNANKIGIFGNYLLNSHTGNFINIPDVESCCKKYDNATNGGFSLGGLFEMPMSNIFGIQARLGYAGLGATLTKQDFIGYALDANDQVIEANAAFTLKMPIHSIFLEPGIYLTPFDFPLRFNINLDANYLLSINFEENEELLSAKNVHFLNGTSPTMINSTGSLSKAASFLIGASAGLSYDIKLSKNLILAPEVSYQYNFTSVMSDIDWKVNSFRAGIALKYAIIPEVLPEEKPPVQEEPKQLLVNTTAYGLNEDSFMKPVLQFTVEEFLSNQVKPLISYVFFDDNSSEIPSRYYKLSKDQTGDFDEKKIAAKDIIDIYYDMLNIIGKRMLLYPNAKIQVEGCNSNSGTEKNNTALSQKRAENVRDYFVNVWGIDASRIIVQKRNLPIEPSNPNEPDGIVENRRVEITSDVFDIIAPITIDDTLRKVDPPSVRFVNNVNSQAGVSSWNLTAFQKGNLLKHFSGSDNVPQNIDWSFDYDQKSAPKMSAPVDYQLTVKDNSGQNLQSPMKSLPVNYISIQKKKRDKINDKFIDRYALMHFGFDASKISKYNGIVIDKIKQHLKPNSTIVITGHTDRIGNPDYNLKLSTQRAKTVADAFAPFHSTSKGLGIKSPMTTNDLPEGRFYNRCVEIIVETPMDGE